MTDEKTENVETTDVVETPQPPEVTPPKPAKEKKPPLKVGGKLMGIIPQDLDEAWRLVEAMYAAGMTPNSYEVEQVIPRTDGNGRTVDVKQVDPQATKARLMIGVMKGMEIGLPPVTALSTICIINNKPCLWGDGAVALVQSSGKIEYIKTHYTGDDETKDDFTAHYIVKRKDQDEPLERTFSMGDAKKARLLGKKGPWAYGYAKRMCMMRAQAWALRDACSDVLMGIGIAEEVRDHENIQEKREDTNLSSLDDDFTPALEDKTEDVQTADFYTGPATSEKEPVKQGVPAQGSLLGNAD